MFWTVQQTLLFPLLLLAGMLLPIDGGPGWLQALSKANPLTYIVDAMRSLFAGSFDVSLVAQGTLAAAGGLRARGHRRGAVDAGRGLSRASPATGTPGRRCSGSLITLGAAALVFTVTGCATLLPR